MRRDIEAIKADIKKAGQRFGGPVENIFFEDGNAFVVKAETLIELTEYRYRQHPNLRTISSYAHVKDILKKFPISSLFSMVFPSCRKGYL